MTELVAATTADIPDLTAFLREADLTLSGLDSSSVRLWIMRDASGCLVASTGYESSDDGQHVLLRSVAVAPDHRGGGLGHEVARFAIERASEAGAERAWLFSRRSGPFWQKLGYEAADRDELASVLASTHQV